MAESKSLAQLFQELGIPDKHLAAFTAEEIVVSDLPGLPEAELTKLLPLGPRTRLLAWIAQQRQASQPQTPAPPNTAAVAKPAGVASALGTEVDIKELGLEKCPIIGEGAFGAVYRGEWQNTAVAIKVLSAGGCTERDLQMFSEEISLMRSLRHPNLVACMAACTKPPKLALVMELMSKGSLAQALYGDAEGKGKLRLTDEQKLQIASDTVSALCFLHGRVLHRDLKPENIMLDNKLTAKLADFGLSQTKHFASTQSKRLGTLLYMAPECHDDKRVDEKVDIYALGVVLAELWSSERPWSRLSQVQIVRKVGVDKQHPPVPAEMPAALAQLAEDCMSHEASQRPSAMQVKARLEQLKGVQVFGSEPWAIPQTLREAVKWERVSEELHWAQLDEKEAVQSAELSRIRAACQGLTVTRVLLLDNTTLSAAFAAQYKRLQTLCASTGFRAADFSSANKQALNLTLSQRLVALPGIRGLGTVYNGTSWRIAEKIAKAGMVNVKLKDVGYFGSGCYATFQPAYAALYPSELYPAEETDRGELALVQMFALFGNVLPITRPEDYDSKSGQCVLMGKPMASFHDTHFVQVAEELGYQAVDPAKPPREVQEEVVFKNEAQLLPRLIIYFKAGDNKQQPAPQPVVAVKPDPDALSRQAHDAARAQDHKKAAELWQAAAAQGHAESLCCLGGLSRDGRGVARDDKRAVALFTEALGKGSSEAAAALGEMHYLGRGVSKDSKKAVELYQQGAQANNVAAMYWLGTWFHAGYGVPKDHGRADELHQRVVQLGIAGIEAAAAEGDAAACFLLGRMHGYGHAGVQQDVSRAVQLYQAAARWGHAGAAYNIGHMYENSEGVTQDYKKALGYYQAAAAQGDARAQCSLGWMHEQGHGVPRDLAVAKQWYAMAAARGHDKAKKGLARLAGNSKVGKS